MKILGLSCFYHDSAVAAVEDGMIRFAVQEERLSRVKHDARFPLLSIIRALEFCHWRIEDVDCIAFYERPDLKLERIFAQTISEWPHSWPIYRDQLPQFSQFKYPVEQIIRDKLRFQGEVRFCEHHQSHAASSFYTSPFERALVLTVDGVGESETTVAYWGYGNTLTKLAAIHFPDSLGLFYSVFTQYLGFEVNEGEYKLMGLAPYGTPRYTDRLLGEVLILDPEGAFHLNPHYFDFASRERHYRKRLVRHIGVPPRTSKDPMTPLHQDLAASVQQALEIALRHVLCGLLTRYPSENVCLAGGVALNCTANAQMIRDLGIRLHIHPAAGDAGTALGAALDTAITYCSQQPYRFAFTPDLGLEAPDAVIEATLALNDIPVQRAADITVEVARRLAAGEVIAVCWGREEWGPRALGFRSILADPRHAQMKEHVNAKIKFREEFRPFAPAVMLEHYAEYFETLGMEASPYMLFTQRVHKPDVIPAVVHVDNTSRVQTVSEAQNPRFYAVLREFYQLTGVPVLMNTSFNLRGEPIVSSPSDALKTFAASGIDGLALGNYWIEKSSL